MDLDIITIVKINDYKGEASIKLINDEGSTLLLNKLVIDLTDGANPVNVMKHGDTPIYSGTWIEGIKSYIIDLWQDYFKDLEIGIYKVTNDGIESMD